MLSFPFRYFDNIWTRYIKSKRCVTYQNDCCPLFLMDLSPMNRFVVVIIYFLLSVCTAYH